MNENCLKILISLYKYFAVNNLNISFKYKNEQLNM